MISVKKRFQWMENRDGLLREPEPMGPYYDRDSFGTYDTEEEAIEDWRHKKAAHPFGVPGELVLMPVYQLIKE